MANTPADVMNMAKEAGVKIVDFRFFDLLGTWQHTSKSIEDVGFDGSSIRGFQAINESDMLMMPDRETAAIDPYTSIPTLTLVGDIYDPVTRERYTRDPRGVAQRAEAYLKASGLGDTAYFGRNPSSSSSTTSQYHHQRVVHYSVDSVEGFWNTGADEGPNLGYKIRPK